MPKCSAFSRSSISPSVKILVSLLHAADEFRNHVLPTHIRSVDIVRAKNYDSSEALTTVVQRDDLTDQLTCGVGIAWIERIGNAHWHRLIGRDDRRFLIDLRAGCQYQFVHVVSETSIDYV